MGWSDLAMLHGGRSVPPFLTDRSAFLRYEPNLLFLLSLRAGARLLQTISVSEMGRTVKRFFVWMWLKRKEI